MPTWVSIGCIDYMVACIVAVILWCCSGERRGWGDWSAKGERWGQGMLRQMQQKYRVGFYLSRMLVLLQSPFLFIATCRFAILHVVKHRYTYTHSPRSKKWKISGLMWVWIVYFVVVLRFGKNSRAFVLIRVFIYFVLTVKRPDLFQIFDNFS